MRVFVVLREGFEAGGDVAAITVPGVFDTVEAAQAYIDTVTHSFARFHIAEAPLSIASEAHVA